MARRMVGDTRAPEWLLGSHAGEHDWDKICDDEPMCFDVAEPKARKNGAGTVPESKEIAEVFTPTYDPAPPHYQGHGVEPWEIIDAFGLGFYDGNVLKYLLRAGKKDAATRLDDLKKCRNYVNKLIELEEQKDE